jgi:uncharacterized protein
MKRVLRVAIAIALLAASALALDVSKFKPTGYVNDFAGVMDARSSAEIEAYCGNLERATGAQVAVVTVPSLEDDSIEDAANKLFQAWGIGKKGTDEGLLIMLAIQDRKQRAEVGYGLEPMVTDAFAGRVLRSIRPILRQGDYGGALLAAVQQFGAQIAQAKGVTVEGQLTPRGTQPAPNGGGSVFGLIFGIFMVVLFIRLISGGGRGGGGRFGGGGTGFLAGMILGNMMNRGRRGGWGGGGFGGYDGGGGGGGFGGFGGFGGGGSGGGGASGGW